MTDRETKGVPLRGLSPTRRAFLAHLRHELRTPINAILGYSEMLIEDAAAAAGQESILPDLQKIHDAGERLLDLVNRLLDPAAEADAGELDLDRLEAQLRHDLREPIHTVVGYAELLQEDVAEAGSTPEALAADLAKIHAAAKRLLEVIGDIGRLTDLNAEAERAEVAEHVLPVARAAVGAIQALEREPANRDGRREAHLLVADDNATNRELLWRRLSRAGYRVTVAEHGREATQRLAEHQFDLVLLDVMMPELNGYDVLRQIKASAQLRHIPVIMISALDEIDSVIRCIELGAEDYLAKPFDPVLLRARIDSSLEKKWLRDRERAYLEQLRIERERSEALLLNILPQPVAERLKQGETSIADSLAEVTVLFADLVGFTTFSTRIPPTELVQRLNQVFSTFDDLAERYDLEKIKTIGDAYMVVGGAPTPRPDHAEAIAAMALEMLEITRRSALENAAPLSIRMGIHTGPVVAGVVGTKKFAYDLWGDTVNTASRMETYGVPNAIQVSEASYARLKDRYCFDERGEIEIKGKGRMRVFLLTGRK